MFVCTVHTLIVIIKTYPIKELFKSKVKERGYCIGNWFLWCKWFAFISSIKFHNENEWPNPPQKINVKFITVRQDLHYYIQYASSPLFSGSPLCHTVIVSFIVIKFELTFMWLPEVNIVLTCLGSEPASEQLHCSLRVLVQIMNGNLHKCSIMLYIDDSFDALTILYCTVLLLLSGIIKKIPPPCIKEEASSNHCFIIWPTSQKYSHLLIQALSFTQMFVPKANNNDVNYTVLCHIF